MSIFLLIMIFYAIYHCHLSTNDRQWQYQKEHCTVLATAPEFLDKKDASCIMNAGHAAALCHTTMQRVQGRGRKGAEAGEKDLVHRLLGWRKRKAIGNAAQKLCPFPKTLRTKLLPATALVECSRVDLGKKGKNMRTTSARTGRNSSPVGCPSRGLCQARPVGMRIRSLARFGPLAGRFGAVGSRFQGSRFQLRAPQRGHGVGSFQEGSRLPFVGFGILVEFLHGSETTWTLSRTGPRRPDQAAYGEATGSSAAYRFRDIIPRKTVGCA